MNLLQNVPRWCWAITSALILVAAITVVLLRSRSIDQGQNLKNEPRVDFAAASAAAARGGPEAQHMLGRIYAEGKQVKLDYRQAANWYRKAAEQGLAKAQYDLGVLLEIGQGVARD